MATQILIADDDPTIRLLLRGGCWRSRGIGKYAARPVMVLRR